MKPAVALFSLICIFGAASLVLYLVATQVSSNIHSNDGPIQFRYPSNLNDLKELAAEMKSIKDTNSGQITLLFCCAYLYKQSFAIPGSVFLNILSGALFGIYIGFPLVCLLSATGATCCYCWSKCFGKPILLHYCPDKLEILQKKIDENSDGLFFFLLCLRLFPMSPNWFLNMASPILGIPIHFFFASVFIGLMPYNFIYSQAGCILSEISSLNHILTLSVALKMAFAATVVAAPGMLLRRSKRERLKHD